MPKIRHANINIRKQRKNKVNKNRIGLVASAKKAHNQAQLRKMLITLSELVSDLIQTLEEE